MKNSKLSNDLCQDLIIEIFTRLPVKSLLRFRSLSKSLCACICSPDFIRLHTLRSPEKLLIVRRVYHKGVYYPNHIYTLHSESQLSLSPCTSVTAVEYPFKGFGVVGSSNGIICLCEFGDGINLWNPSTKRKLSVQDRPSWIHTWRPFGDQLSYHVFGFGYNPIMDDYKILRWTKQSKPDTLKVYSVYTLKTDTWCEIPGPATPYSRLYSSQCLFNGTLHWVAKYLLPKSEGSRCSYHIMTFDLSTDVFSAIPLPEHSGDTTQVTIIKGYLAVISSDNDDCTWIWVRKQEYSGNSYSWSVAFKFETTGNFKRRSWDQVLQLTADGDLLWMSVHDEIVAFNPKTGMQSRLENLRESKFSYVYVMEKCVESLELLHMGTSCQGRKLST